MNKNKIYNYIDDNLDTHIQNIQSWVKQKSVSWDNLGMDDASKMDEASKWMRPQKLRRPQKWVRPQ